MCVVVVDADIVVCVVVVVVAIVGVVVIVVGGCGGGVVVDVVVVVVLVVVGDDVSLLPLGGEGVGQLEGSARCARVARADSCQEQNHWKIRVRFSKTAVRNKTTRK